MNLSLEIEYADPLTETATVSIRPKVQVEYERHFSTKDNPVRLGSSDLSMENMYWLAWKASATTTAFDAWLDDIDSVTAHIEDDEDDGRSGPLAEGQHSGQS